MIFEAQENVLKTPFRYTYFQCFKFTSVPLEQRMKAIYNKTRELVGWVKEPDSSTQPTFIFDTSRNPIAFMDGDHVFSFGPTTWLGSFRSGCFHDRDGAIVAWVKGATPSLPSAWPQPLVPLAPLEPLGPLKPLPPLKPMTPLIPRAWWSSLGWENWLSAS